MLNTDTCQTFGSPFHLLRLRAKVPFLCALMLVLSANVFSQGRTRVLQNPTSFTSVPKNLLIRMLRAEDERRWDKDVRDLLSARSAIVRSRAVLAAGRIGYEDCVPDLIKLLRHDDETGVRAMAAFALGEVESASAADALLEVLSASNEPLVRARAVEALGKIAAALPKEQEARMRQLGDGILEALKFESARRSAPDRLSVLLGLTAALRAKTSSGGTTIAGFLTYSDPHIRADAANTLARLKLKDGNDQLRKLLVSDPDPVVRANAARVLGATEDKASFDALLDRALKDKDSRVRVSAIRALGNLKVPGEAAPLLDQAQKFAALYQHSRWYKSEPHPAEINEILEITATLGRTLANTSDLSAISFLHELRKREDFDDPELEIAYARIAPGLYLRDERVTSVIRRNEREPSQLRWKKFSALAQGLATVAEIKGAATGSAGDNAQQESENDLRRLLDKTSLPALAEPDVLRAWAIFKPRDQSELLHERLKQTDVIVRSTAAELIGELPPDETNTRALIAALPRALADRELNDAALAIVGSLAKQKSAKANDAIKTALDSQDYLIRRKAVALLKANGAGDFSTRIGIVQTRNTAQDYERATSRFGKQVDAIVTTDKGSFTIRLLPDEATLNVDNFVQLAKRRYFNGITVHRVVPNFVIQDGDPRGDGNGGPGYQIRCEINEVPYERGAVGMALSGKDTGGSQWFVTHSPQPHLDGGYTVFGKVVRGMNVVDKIVRGDVIRSIVIRETAGRVTNRRQ